jgi:hypothetical protein
MIYFRYLLLLLPVLFLGCNNDSVVAPQVVQGLPSQFRLTGEAQSTFPDGFSVDCQLDLIFELRSETSRNIQSVIYDGVHGGEVFRRILDSTGAGFAFHADVFGEVDAHLLTQTGIVNLLIPINLTADGRFWRAMSSFDGFVNEAGIGSGTWSCEPLDLDQGGYVDTTYIIQGTWRTEPIQ